MTTFQSGTTKKSLSLLTEFQNFMKGKKSTPLLLISLFLIHFSSAQVTISELTKTHQQTFRFATEKSSYDSHQNTIISEIARSIPKSPDVTTFTADFQSLIRMKKIDSLNYTLFCELKDMKFSGDISYRNINISHLLIPDIIDFGITIKGSKGSGQHSHKQTYSNIPMKNNLGYFTILQTEFKDTIANCDYQVSIEHILCKYSIESVDFFRQNIQLINEYYLSDHRIDEMNSIIQGIDINKIERISFNSIVLKEVESDFDKLMQYDFPNQLNLWLSDPIRFKVRTEELKKNIDILRYQINTKLEQLDRLYYEYGMNALKTEKFDSAQFYFKKAVEYNFAFVPALIELSHLEYRNGTLDTAAQTIIYILDYTIPQNDDVPRLNEVTRLIISSLKESVQRRLLSQDYVEAQYLLEFGLKICQRSAHLMCYDDMDKLMAQVKYGLYKSLLTVVEKAIENKRFDIAWIYIKNALAYQEENRQYIITPIETEKYYDILFSSCVKQAEQLNKQKLFVQSLDLIQWIENICDTVQKINCRSLVQVKSFTLTGLYNERLDKIEVDIKNQNFQAADTRLKLLSDFVQSNPEIILTSRFHQAESHIQTFRYQSAISEALRNIEYNFYEPAWEHLLDAIEIQNTYNIQKYSNIDSLFRIVTEPVFVIKFNKIINKSSSYSIAKLQNIQIEYGEHIQANLMQMPDTIVKLQNRLKTIITERLCDSIQNQINQLSVSGEEMIRQHHFIAADSIFKNAIGMCNSYSQCEIDSKPFIELAEKLSVAIQWEESVKHLNLLLAGELWADCIRQFAIADELSSNQYLFMWNIPRTTLEEFIIQQKSVGFLFYGFEYFYENKQYEQAFLMLDHLRKLKHPVEQTIELQKRLGLKLAVRDIINDPHANQKINILKYTEGEEYFSYFSKAYRKTWRKNKFKII